MITNSSARRISRLYRSVVGYEPYADGWTPAEALDVLREWKREGFFKSGA